MKDVTGRAGASLLLHALAELCRRVLGCRGVGVSGKMTDGDSHPSPAIWRLSPVARENAQ